MLVCGFERLHDGGGCASSMSGKRVICTPFVGCTEDCAYRSVILVLGVFPIIFSTRSYSFRLSTPNLFSLGFNPFGPFLQVFSIPVLSTLVISLFDFSPSFLFHSCVITPRLFPPSDFSLPCFSTRFPSICCLSPGLSCVSFPHVFPSSVSAFLVLLYVLNNHYLSPGFFQNFLSDL